MISKFFTFLVLNVSTTLAYCQTKKEIGIEGGLIFQQSNFSSSNNMLQSNTFLAGLGGLNYRITNKNNWFVQGSFLAYRYSTSIKAAFLGGWSDEDYGDVISVPIEFGKQLPLGKKWSVATSIGLAPTFQTYNAYETEQPFDGNLANAGQYNSYFFTYSYPEQKAKTYLLGKATLHLQANVGKRVQLVFGLNYWKGFTTMYTLNTHWRQATTPWQQGTATSKGSMLSFNLGAKYALNFKR